MKGNPRPEQGDQSVGRQVGTEDAIEPVDYYWGGETVWGVQKLDWIRVGKTGIVRKSDVGCGRERGLRCRQVGG